MVGLSEYLIEHQIVSGQELSALAPEMLGDASQLAAGLRKSGLVPSATIAQALAACYGVPLVQPGDWPRAAVGADSLSAAFLRANKVLPLSQSLAGVVVAIADPGDHFAVSAVRLATGRPVIVKVATPEDIDAAIERRIQLQETPADPARATVAGDAETDRKSVV